MRRDSLSRLIARSFGQSDVIQPVLPSRFEPSSSVPSFNSMGFGADQERQRSAVPLGSAVNPEAPKVHPLEPGAHKDVDASRHFAPAPRSLPSPSVEPPFGSRSPMPRNISTPRPPGDEDSTAGAGVLSSNLKSTLPPGPTLALPPDQLNQLLGQHEQAGQPNENGPARRSIIPSEVYARRPEPDTPKQEITGGDNLRPESSGGEVSQSQSVTVHIGRIEVRAIVAPGSETEKKRPADNRQRLTLADYLQQREKGAR